jgi:uracil-DNA glycosylase family 4
MLLSQGANRLADLHAEIDGCHKCDKHVIPLVKPLGLCRGDPGKIIVIGEGPGRAEKKKARAFAGPSGKELERWLVQCSASPHNPRHGIYFTSIIKCVKNSERDLVKMKYNCRHFLDNQLSIIMPTLVISLGAHAYNALRFTPEPFETAICKKYYSADYLLIPPYDSHFYLVVWPHPSPVNRWFNIDKNKQRLKESFELVRPFISDLVS